MEQNELISYVSVELSKLAVPHYITGSIASGIYGESRTTNDVDSVADLGAGQVGAFLAAFPGDRFYVSREAAQQAVASRGQFIVDTDSSSRWMSSFRRPRPKIKLASIGALIALSRRASRSPSPPLKTSSS